ncbi:bifunctional hydroxymethylpyrimidine kinase/phosphomethylpyrimidine kinase [Bacillus carboniphilus]|uniref:Hydroxymethylpyrimidine/phosphomethylpyrimidine kinase n=1 Tax=Bacillus carboniphilus TaxID=86663 RepID=A0ABY9JWT0_9BACI|nr:bifunctional hydroxymethylpyrimidine kinase/phosphomethylpyrimidine kinase [Bacillus carboniphilus]WLR42962.1 bifunctional hydroxymethylpyrimidine kinase/phosphomethylpyrimidine kinase [Bacillus carboniphilus]
MNEIKKVLTIAGSDSGGGAGIQADIKTFQQFHVFGMTAITAVTAQNTTGVQGIYPLALEGISKQIDAVATDLRPDAVKTGMLFNEEVIELVSTKVKEHKITQLVIDPVMIAKGGQPLLQSTAVRSMKEKLIPQACVITPNIPEAEALVGMKIERLDDRKKAAKALHNLGAKNVIIKGGHDSNDQKVVDLLYDGEEFHYFEGERVNTPHTHGTGCTFSAALTACLAKGSSIVEATEIAKNYIQEAIQNTLHFGSGHGPTNHWAYHMKKID